MVTHKMSTTESNEFLGSLLSNIPFGFIALDESGYITLINNLAIEYLDLKPQKNDLIKLQIKDCVQHITVLSATFAKRIQNIKKSFDLESVAIINKYLDINAR